MSKLNSIEDSTDYARLQLPEAEYQELNEIQSATDNDKEDGEPLYNNPAYYHGTSKTTDEYAEYQEIKEIPSADCSQDEPVYKTVINPVYGDILEEEQPSRDNYVPNPLYGGVKEQGQ